MPKTLTDIDRRLGERMRERRLALGLTQTDIARALGVSFQQVQKFEKGRNRINAVQLGKIAERLGLSMGEFYGDASPQPGFAEPSQTPLGPAASDPARTAETMALVEAFLRIGDPAVRRALVDLARQIAAQGRSE
jgi:transcriptional regulator with XRE-family HTH domain